MDCFAKRLIRWNLFKWNALTFAPTSVIEHSCQQIEMTSDITVPSYMPVEHSAHEASKATLDNVNFGYSLKNIPISQNHQYMRCLVDKLNSFVTCLRWKAFYYNEAESEQVKNYGFKSEKCPPQISEHSI